MPELKCLCGFSDSEAFIAATDGTDKQRLRTGEKLVGLCRKAWRVVHRLFPDEFDKDVPNPWTGVTLKVRTKNKKPAVTRDEVYAFAYGCIAHGEVEAAAVAVICFEWLQRPRERAGRAYQMDRLSQPKADHPY